MYIKETQNKTIKIFLLNTGKVRKHTAKKNLNFICFTFFKKVFFQSKEFILNLTSLLLKEIYRRISLLFKIWILNFKEMMLIVKHLLQNDKSKPSNHFIGVGFMPAVNLWNCPGNTNTH